MRARGSRGPTSAADGIGPAGNMIVVHTQDEKPNPVAENEPGIVGKYRASPRFRRIVPDHDSQYLPGMNRFGPV